MAATDLGKVGIVMKDEWDSTVPYEALDAVKYLGDLYIAKIDTPANTLPTNTDYWTLALTSTKGTLGCEPGTFTGLTDANDIPIGTFLNGAFAAWSGIAHTPESSFAGVIYCLKGYAGLPWQFAIYYQDNYFYLRRSYSGGAEWTAWKKISLV